MFEVVAGLIGGVLGAGAMRALIAPSVRGEPSEPALLLARISGGDASAYPALGTVAHVLYGALAGALFAVVTAGVLGWDGGLWVAGLFFGMVLAAVAMLGWSPRTGMQERLAALEPGERARRFALFLGGHALYGVVLGAVVQLLTA
jgi:hypothetical protein